VRNSEAFQQKVTELFPGETFITLKADDIGDLGMDLGRGYKRISSSRYRPELQGPPVKVENLQSVQATYELNPQTNVWETVTIFPAEL
jgi:filamentous hemagglutinin